MGDPWEHRTDPCLGVVLSNPSTRRPETGSGVLDYFLLHSKLEAGLSYVRSHLKSKLNNLALDEALGQGTDEVTLPGKGE